MDSLLALVTAQFREAIHQAFGRQDVEVTSSHKPEESDYQCNSALKLAKELKAPPREIAQQLVIRLDRTLFADSQIGGPGFINVKFKDSFLEEQAIRALSDPRLGIPLPKRPQKVIVEFSSPNIAKELHVGHLRSTIIGDALARLFEFLGESVLRLNHVGDWGTQFGMLITYMQEVCPAVLTGEQKADLPSLMEWYRLSKKRFDESPEFKKRAQLQVVQLQRGDAFSLAAWERICEISRKGYQEIYDLLDIHLQERGESFYNPQLASVVADLEQKGLVTLSDGAKCIYLEGFRGREGEPLPMIIQKSDGGYNYDTTDMAALKHRIEDEKADRILCVTDAGQSLHFQMLIAAAKKAGYFREDGSPRFDHVPFGVVLGADGKKFKTRSGDTEKLIDLLLEAVSQAKEILRRRLPDLAERELEEVAKILGVDAIKYADLACHRIKDYLFSYERMLKFEGNTAAFLLYAYVRIQSIKRKVGKEISAVLQQERIAISHPSERSLLLHLLQFQEVLLAVSEELAPNRLTEYLYTLAEKFNAFFRDCRVEGSKEEGSRLLIAELVAKTLKQGLEILGLKTLNQM